MEKLHWQVYTTEFRQQAVESITRNGLSIADKHLVAETFDQLDEPGAVAAGLKADDHVAREAGVEVAEVIRLMIQLGKLDCAVRCIAVANSLLTRVKVHTTINSHGHLIRGLMRKMRLPQLTREPEVSASSHHNPLTLL